jgi:hypothetical protein
MLLTPSNQNVSANDLKLFRHTYIRDHLIDDHGDDSYDEYLPRLLQVTGDTHESNGTHWEWIICLQYFVCQINA